MDKFLFEKVYKENRDSIYNYIKAFVLDRQISEDLTQEVFINVFKSLSSFRGDCRLRVWLFSIAKKICFTWLKKNTPIKKSEMDIDELHCEGASSNMEKNMLIREILATLDPKQKSMIILRDYYCFTYREIAMILELSEGQVKIGIHRARKAFRSLYERMAENDT